MSATMLHEFQPFLKPSGARGGGASRGSDLVGDPRNQSRGRRRELGGGWRLGDIGRRLEAKRKRSFTVT